MKGCIGKWPPEYSYFPHACVQWKEERTMDRTLWYTCENGGRGGMWLSRIRSWIWILSLVSFSFSNRAMPSIRAWFWILSPVSFSFSDRAMPSIQSWFWILSPVSSGYSVTVKCSTPGSSFRILNSVPVTKTGSRISILASSNFK